ncbi:hypothetical protein BU15DRAFT_69499 [Melanogaster broomeanus]|nr:hypothetical protein BU15DRAFT_69499 [Melanogaster broomeanus]
MSDEQRRQMGAADVICARWKREMNEHAAERTASANEPPTSQGSLMREDAGMDNRPTSPPCCKMVPQVVITSCKASPEPEPAFVLLKGMVDHKEACLKSKGRGPTRDKAEMPSGHPVCIPKAGLSKVSKDLLYEGSDGSSDVQIVSSQPKRKHKALSELQFQVLSLEVDLAEISRDLGEVGAALVQLRSEE